jgi:chromate reductase, NAD(P)H dehydrogenase (quinone)
MQPSFRVLGISGSLRRHSFNSALLAAAEESAPEGVTVVPHAVDDLPFYNPDLERPDAVPASVRAFRTALREADALLIATPEYNHSLPAVLKNAVDWASRPVRFEAPLAGMPVALMGAATGAVGTARAQEHLLSVLLATGAFPMGHPSLIVGKAAERFDDSGRLTDAATRARLAALLEALRAWAHRLAPVTSAA